jgi:S-(hydroxymethyl)mycothiol dehydrogenase
VEQYRLGRLDLDGFVSERIGITEVEEAFGKMKAGKVLRSVVEISSPGGGPSATATATAAADLAEATR